MGRQADPAFRQQKPCIETHFPVEPRVGFGRFGPCAVIQSRQNHQIGALNPRLERAPDHDQRVRRVPVSHFALTEDAADQVRVIRRSQFNTECRLVPDGVHGLAGLLPGFLQPQPPRIAAFGTVRNGFCQRDVSPDPVRKHQFPRHLLGACQIGHPGCPTRHPVNVILVCKAGAAQQAGFVGIGQTQFAHAQFQFLRLEHVFVPHMTRMGERMFEQGQQRLGIQWLVKKAGHMAQEPAGWRQMQWRSRTVIGQNVPTVEGRRHLPRQHPVRRYQGGALAGFGGRAQPHGDGDGLRSRGISLDQCDGGCCVFKIGKLWPLDTPGIGHRGRSQRQRNQAVPGDGRGDVI